MAMLVARAVFQNRTQKNKARRRPAAAAAFPFCIKVVCEGFRSESCFSMTHTMLISLARHKAVGARTASQVYTCTFTVCLFFIIPALLHLFHGQLGTLKTGHCSTFVWYNLSMNFSTLALGSHRGLQNCPTFATFRHSEEISFSPPLTFSSSFQPALLYLWLNGG